MLEKPVDINGDPLEVNKPFYASVECSDDGNTYAVLLYVRESYSGLYVPTKNAGGYFKIGAKGDDGEQGDPGSPGEPGTNGTSTEPITLYLYKTSYVDTVAAPTARVTTTALNPDQWTRRVITASVTHPLVYTCVQMEVTVYDAQGSGTVSCVWTKPALTEACDPAGHASTSYADYLALTAGGTRQGLYWDSTNTKLYINANDIRTGTIMSNNYADSSEPGDRFAASGTKILMDDGQIKSTGLFLDAYGNVGVRGYIEASSGQIGLLKLTTNGSLRFDGSGGNHFRISKTAGTPDSVALDVLVQGSLQQYASLHVWDNNGVRTGELGGNWEVTVPGRTYVTWATEHNVNLPELIERIYDVLGWDEPS